MLTIAIRDSNTLDKRHKKLIASSSLERTISNAGYEKQGTAPRIL
jgi:hypothetical protein